MSFWRVTYTDETGRPHVVATRKTAQAALKDVAHAPKRFAATDLWDEPVQKPWSELARGFLAAHSIEGPDSLIYGFRELTAKQHTRLMDSLPGSSRRALHQIVDETRRKQAAHFSKTNRNKIVRISLYGLVQRGRVLLHFNRLDAAVRQAIYWTARDQVSPADLSVHYIDFGGGFVGREHPYYDLSMQLMFGAFMRP